MEGVGASLRHGRVADLAERAIQGERVNGKRVRTLHVDVMNAIRQAVEEDRAIQAVGAAAGEPPPPAENTPLLRRRIRELERENGIAYERVAEMSAALARSEARLSVYMGYVYATPDARLCPAQGADDPVPVPCGEGLIELLDRLERAESDRELWRSRALASGGGCLASVIAGGGGGEDG